MRIPSFVLLTAVLIPVQAVIAQNELHVDPREILREVAAAYSRADAYDVTGRLRVAATAEGDGFELNFRVARDGEAFRSVSVDGGPLRLRYVKNLEGTYLYSPSRNQYAELRDLVPAQVGALIHDLVEEYRQIDQGVREARIALSDSTEALVWMDSLLVVDVRYQDPESVAGGKLMRKRLWVTRDRRVVRDQTTSIVHDPNTGRDHALQESVEFEEVRFGSPDADVFVFDPPRSAMRVSMADLTGTTGAVDIGRLAPSFRLPRLDQGTLELSQLVGEIVVLNFWATWCGPCRMEMPELEKLHRAYARRGVRVVGVNLGEPAEIVRDYVSRYGYTFDVLLDQDGSLDDLYGIQSLPMTVIIDRLGRIAEVLHGAHPIDEFEAAISRIQN